MRKSLLRLKKNYNFDPNISFLSLKITRHAFLFIGILASVSFLSIFLNGNLSFNLSAAGFNEFVSIFKFPLSMLALTIPIVGLLAVNHRSEQTKLQIKLSSEQNNFVNHYKHIEEFEKFCEKKIDTIPASKTRELHFKIYPKSRNGNYSTDKDLLRNSEKRVKNILIKTISINSTSEIAILCDLIKRNLLLIINDFFIDFTPIRSKIYEQRDGSENWDPSKHEELRTLGGDILSLKSVVQQIDNILKFDHSYTTPTYLEFVLTISNIKDLEKIAYIEGKYIKKAEIKDVLENKDYQYFCKEVTELLKKQTEMSLLEIEREIHNSPQNQENDQ